MILNLALGVGIMAKILYHNTSRRLYVYCIALSLSLAVILLGFAQKIQSATIDSFFKAFYTQKVTLYSEQQRSYKALDPNMMPTMVV